MFQKRVERGSVEQPLPEGLASSGRTTLRRNDRFNKTARNVTFEHYTTRWLNSCHCVNIFTKFFRSPFVFGIHIRRLLFVASKSCSIPGIGKTFSPSRRIHVACAKPNSCHRGGNALGCGGGRYSGTSKLGREEVKRCPNTQSAGPEVSMPLTCETGASTSKSVLNWPQGSGPV